MSWAVIGCNPAPGDVGEVLRVAAEFGSVGSQAESLVSRLRQLDGRTGPELWRGQAADVFRRRLADVGPAAVRMAGSYREAEDSMRCYADALRVNQMQAGRADQDAERASSDESLATLGIGRETREHAEQGNIYQQCKELLAQANALQAQAQQTGDLAYYAKLVEYERQVLNRQAGAKALADRSWIRLQEHEKAKSAAEARVEAAKLLAAQTAELHEIAAQRAAHRLDAASEVAPRRPPPIIKFITELIVGSVRSWMSMTFDEFFGLVGLMGDILSLVGLALSFFPPLWPLAVALSIAGLLFSGLFLGWTWIQFTQGKKSAGDLAWAVVSVLPGLDLASLGKRVVKPLLKPGPVGLKIGWFNQIGSKSGTLPIAYKKIDPVEFVFGPLTFLSTGKQLWDLPKLPQRIVNILLRPGSLAGPPAMNCGVNW